MDPTAHRALLAASALTLSSCTALFDPSQYWTDGGVEATDAFVPPGVDADLDAFVPPTDAWAPDVYVPPDIDADLDAVTAPDAFSVPAWCPAAADLALPTCESPSRLQYCDVERSADVVDFPAEVAEALLGTPRARGFRFGFLGNGLDVLGALPRGSIADQELGREGDTLLLTVARNLPDTRVTRHAWTIDLAALSSPTMNGYDLGALGASRVTDLSHATTSEMSIVYEASGTARAARCDADSCSDAPFTTAPVGTTAWVAQSSLGPVAASPVPLGPRLEFELLGSAVNGNLNYPDLAELNRIEGLRQTNLPLVYTTGLGPQRAIDVSGAATLFRIGDGLPRITTGDVSTTALIGRTRTVTPATTIGTVAGYCVASPCTCDGCDGEIVEASVGSDLPVVDWNLHNLDSYFRVAVLLMGNGSGTRVVVAMWDVHDAPVTLAPIVIASGRSPLVGRGRSVRSVARRQAESIEVFASVVADFEESDRLFLTGLRLLNCGG